MCAHLLGDVGLALLDQGGKLRLLLGQQRLLCGRGAEQDAAIGHAGVERQ